MFGDMYIYIYIYIYPPTPLPARGRRWGSVRLALQRDCGSLLPSLSPSPVQPCTLPAFFLSFFSCSSSFLFFPFPFCCRRTPLVGARCGQTSAAWKSAGSEAFVAGRSLWTDSLTAYCILDSIATLGTRPRRSSRSWQDAQQTQRDERPGRGKL